MDITNSDLLTIGISVLCGGLLGFEREYQNKSAGLRTITLICLGSTLFTMVSQRMGSGSDDRVAANIITGIGFIGAGVIFKNNFSVMGLTTAAVIWISAALGMMIGVAEYYLAFFLTAVIVVILSGFSKVEGFVDVINHSESYHVIFINADLNNLYELEKMIGSFKLNSKRKQLTKRENRLDVTLQISGNKKQIKKLNESMVGCEFIYHF